MISIAPGDGRYAEYDPRTDTWTMSHRSPVRFVGIPAAVWTGEQALVVGEGADGSAIGMALEPGGSSVRIADPPLAGPVLDAAWDGKRLIAVAGGSADEDGPARPPGAAAYDPVSARWCVLPLPPVPGRVSLVGTGEGTLALGSPWPAPGPQLLSSLDPLTSSWTTPEPVPSQASGLWVSDRLLFMGDTSAGPDEDGSFDLTSGTWTSISTDCEIHTGGAIWTGSLVIDDTHAYDPASGACFDLPAPRGGILRGSTLVFTGDSLIRWSGNDGEETPSRRTGFIYHLEP